MNIGILHIESEESPAQHVHAEISKASRLLALKGYDVKTVLSVTDASDIIRAAEFLRNDADALIVAGNYAAFCEAFKAQYAVPEDVNVFEADGVIYLIARSLDAEFIHHTAIPALNSKTKTLYTSAIFKTFGESKEALQTTLAECIKNKNRIQVRVAESAAGECEVGVRYSNKTQLPVVDALIARTAELLKDCTYSVKDLSLPETVVELLKLRGQKLCIAESFTGGGLTSALIAVPGASAAVYEGIVAYANDAKHKRLDVETQILERYGAVSIEAVYEMAANMLVSSGCDYAVATTGNAGPAAEKEEDAGRFFIAIGDKKGVHIYQYRHAGTRKEVIAYGVNAALFRLYKKMTENEFAELVRQHDAQENR